MSAGLVLTAACGRIGYGSVDASRPTTADAGEGAVDAGAPLPDAAGPEDAGTAPVDAGTCVEATFAGHDYVYCDSGASFADATAQCAAIGMHLVRLDDAAEQAFVEGVRVRDIVWIGASDAGAENDWRWADGTSFYLDAMAGGAPVGGAYVHWGAAEPNGGARENCGAISASGFWIDYGCGLLAAALCERP